MRLSFDLITGFSLLPIQLMSVAGILVALAGMGFGGFLLVLLLKGASPGGARARADFDAATAGNSPAPA